MTGSPGVTRAGLDALNTIPVTEAERRLSTCCASRAWVERMAAGRPYADLDALLSASDSAVRELDRDDLAEALAGHPRIGQRAAGSSTEAVWSRQEQAGPVMPATRPGRRSRRATAPTRSASATCS